MKLEKTEDGFYLESENNLKIKTLLAHLFVLETTKEKS